MSQIEANLKQLSITLPGTTKPIASYIPCTRSGNLVFISGQLPREDGKIVTGRFGENISIESGKKAAAACVLSALSVLKEEILDLDLIKKCVKITVFINSDGNFTDQSTLANGASDMLVAIFGEKGKHARSSISVASLPLGACLEIEFIFEI